jgi:hypothetical protein
MNEQVRYKLMADRIIILIGLNQDEMKCRSIFINIIPKYNILETLTDAIYLCKEDSEIYSYLMKFKRKYMYDYNKNICNII